MPLNEIRPPSGGGGGARTTVASCDLAGGEATVIFVNRAPDGTFLIEDRPVVMSFDEWREVIEFVRDMDTNDVAYARPSQEETP